jgi:asparagine synthase (glutamine-hydrolysing)
LALATRITGQPVTAYTIGYRPQDGRLEQCDEDARFARLVAAHFNADYHEIVVAPEVVELLPKVIWHMDEPVADAAAISTYIICQAARENLKVLLSGQGGDEVFAGYRVYLGERLHRRLSLVPRVLRGALRSALALLPRAKDCIPGVSPGLLLAGHRYFDKLLRAADLSPEERFICAQTYLSDAELQELYTPELREQIGGYRAAARHLELFRDLPEADFLNRMLYVDMNTFLPELNLTYSDKMSAAASVEIRVPFLDTELVDFANRLHPDLKLKNLTSKYLLKRAVEGLLPHSVIKRRKAGFGAPIRAWLRNDLRSMVDSVLSEEALSKRGYFNPSAVRRMIERDRAGVEDYATRIWNLLTLELWLSTFIDPARIRSANLGRPIAVSTREGATWHFQSNQTFAA